MKVEKKYTDLVEKVRAGFDRCDTLLCQLIEREASNTGALVQSIKNGKDKGAHP